MTDTRISALTPGNPAQVTDVLPIARGGSDYQISVGSIVSLSPSAVGGSTGDIQFNSGTGGFSGSTATITPTGEIVSTSTYSNNIGAFSMLKLNPTYNGVFGSSAVYQTGVDVEVTQSPPADTAIITVAVKGVVFLQGAHNFTFTGGEPSAGGEFFSFHAGSGHANQVMGVVGAAGTYGAGGGSLDTAWGVYAQTGPQGPGPITNDYSIYIASPNILGLMTNHYGLYIQDQTIGGTNNPNSYAIFVEAGRCNLGPGKTIVGTLIESSTLSPSSATTAGTTGQIAWDSNNIYVCTIGGIAGAATWKNTPFTNSILQKSSVVLSASQLINLATTPIQLIAAPGAGLVINLVSAIASYTYGTVAFTSTNSPNLYLDITSASDVTGNFGLLMALSGPGGMDLTSANSQVINGYPSGKALTAANSVNKAIVIGAFSGSIGGSGDGTMRVTVLYTVETA